MPTSSAIEIIIKTDKLQIGSVAPGQLERHVIHKNSNLKT
jgi:hypothetical protein